MEAVLANLATALQGREGGSPLMVGTGKDKVHLLVVCTAERGLAAPSTRRSCASPATTPTG